MTHTILRGVILLYTTIIAAGENCTSFGAAHFTGTLTEGVDFGSLHFGAIFEVELYFRSTSLHAGNNHDATYSPLLQCSSEGANEVGIYAIQNASRATIFAKFGSTNGVEEVRADLPDTPFEDGLWHHVVVQVDASQSTANVSIFVDGISIATSDLSAKPPSGSRSSCWGGASQEDKTYLVSALNGGLRSLHLRSRSSTAGQLYEGGHDSVFSAFCSGCAGPFSTDLPLRNVAYTEAPTEVVIQGYVTLLAVPDHEAALVVYGGDVDCPGVRKERGGVVVSVGGGAGSTAEGAVLRVGQQQHRQENLLERDVEAAVRLRVGVAYYVRVVLSVGRVRVFVDTRLVASEERNYVVSKGSVSLLSACHSMVVRPARAVLQLVEVDCTDRPLLPMSERATPSPPAAMHIKDRVVSAQVDTIWVPSAAGGSYTAWREEPNGWTATQTVYGAGAVNVTAVHIAPYTQNVLVTTRAGHAYSNDGGLSYAAATTAHTIHDSTSLATGLILVVTWYSGAVQVGRSEDMGQSFAYTALPDAGRGVPDTLRVFAWDNGVAYATADRSVIWVSYDSGITWAVDSTANKLLMMYQATWCLPYVWGGSLEHREYAVLGCGAMVLIRAAELPSVTYTWRVAPRTHGMTNLRGIYKIMSSGVSMIAALDGNNIVLGREADVLPHVVWHVAGTAASEVRSIAAVGDRYAVISDTELLISEADASRWVHAGYHPEPCSATGSAAFAPTCTANSACSGRGECYYGLIWPLYPVSCSCRPPYSPPDCGGVIQCTALETLLGRDLQCVTNVTSAAEQDEAPATRDQRPVACTWRREEIRPGILRWRCAPPLYDPYHQTLDEGNFMAVKRGKGKRGYPFPKNN